MGENGCYILIQPQRNLEICHIHKSCISKLFFCTTVLYMGLNKSFGISEIPNQTMGRINQVFKVTKIVCIPVFKLYVERKYLFKMFHFIA